MSEDAAPEQDAVAGDASSSDGEAKDGPPDDADVTLRKVLFDVEPRQSANGSLPSPSKRRRSRQAAIGGLGTVCVPIRAGLTEEQVQGLREVFSLFDPDGSGRVCPKTIAKSAATAGLERDSPEVWRLLSWLESESYESVDFEDFVALLTEPLGDHYSKKGTSRLLNLFGQEAVKADCVTLADMRRLVDDLGIEMEDSDLQAMLDKAGADDEGQLSMDRFYNVMRYGEPADDP
mmetsp:Transcript_52369/g.109117  ORF Transcript_52369/g.109117 Transcript_52369/m.109117 type:complete len:233 (-) Transcript_52369:8-706(-)